MGLFWKLGMAKNFDLGADRNVVFLGLSFLVVMISFLKFYFQLSISFVFMKFPDLIPYRIQKT